jgi:Spy/CpxP family protein refolding chaperone
VVLPLVAVPARGQSPHQHGPGGADPQPHQRVEACERDFEQVVADGRGAGLAFAADQNGYPGPLPVLELKDRLHLTAEQEARMRTLLEAMFAESRPRAAKLADGEARLRRLFATGRADDGVVRAAVADAERARAEVRLAHLLTHLRTHDLLTEEQRRTYQRFAGAPPPSRSSGAGSRTGRSRAASAARGGSGPS